MRSMGMTYAVQFVAALEEAVAAGGKSAIQIHRHFLGRKRNFTGPTSGRGATV